jgi:hypothetical protein
VHNELQKMSTFVDAAVAGVKFLKRVLPARYHKIGFGVDELSDWLRGKLGNAPDRWLTDSRLNEAVEAFVKKGYDTHARKKAAEKGASGFSV